MKVKHQIGVLNVCPLADGAQAKTELTEQHEAAMVLYMKIPIQTYQLLISICDSRCCPGRPVASSHTQSSTMNTQEAPKNWTRASEEENFSSLSS